MKPLLPGQAALARIDGKVSLVACELKGIIPDGPGRCDLRGGLHQIRIANVIVPLVSIVLRYTTGDMVRYYWAWVDELQENVIETLANQPELPIVFADPTGKPFARMGIPNGVIEMAQKALAAISRYAAEAPWRPQHFAAARVFVEWDYPTAEKEWAVLDLTAQSP